MDAKSSVKTIPLVVDLDGTLIAADLLWECAFILVRRNFFYLFMLPIWILTGGKVGLKSEVFSRVDIDASQLPYRADVLDAIKAAKSEGREIVLATASAKSKADQIAAYLGLFDSVVGSDGKRNLRAHAKADYLKATYGDAGFDYMGNSRDDLVVFDAARVAIAVGPDASARAWAQKNNAQIMAEKGPIRIKEYFKMMRVHQWAKNMLIAVAPVLDHRIFELQTILCVIGAFFAFSFLASAVYIFNDLFDLALDRMHATKRNRLLASGRISAGHGIKIGILLIFLSVFITAFLPPLFALVLAGYFVVTTAYSLKLKRWLLLDVLTLAGLYTVRVVAGAAVTDTPPSFWLLAFSFCHWHSSNDMLSSISQRLTKKNA